MVPLYLDFEQSELLRYDPDRSVCGTYPQKQNQTTDAEILLVGRYRCGIASSRLVVEFPDAGYQEDMDQHHGTSDQRLVYLANGSILLGYRLQGLAQTYRMAESIWHEFHRGLYASHVCRVWLHRSITFPRMTNVSACGKTCRQDERINKHSVNAFLISLFSLLRSTVAKVRKKADSRPSLP